MYILYKFKVYRRTTKYFCHDENEECTVGDVVSFIPDTIRSKFKHHRIEKILRPVAKATFKGKTLTAYD
jgi:ribosomal protein S17